MSKEKETVADIVARMRDEGHTGDASCLEWVGAKILHYADRIEAAAERENASLRAAMKPVLECKVLNAMTAEIRPGESDYCSNIIFKAQRIYNEGEERGGVDVFDIP